MQEERIVTTEELVELINTRDCEFIIHVELEGEDAIEER